LDIEGAESGLMLRNKEVSRIGVRCRSDNVGGLRSDHAMRRKGGNHSCRKVLREARQQPQGVGKVAESG